jgi:L-amino acid N-acyltransferase YncA
MSPIIRIATRDDAQTISEIYAPAVLERVTSFELTAPDASECAERMNKVMKTYPWLVCESGGEAIGYTYASTHNERAAYRWSVDVAVYVNARAHRRGVGTALYTSLFEILALQGIRNAYAGITLPNAASVGMHGRVGFAEVGVYHHVGYKFGAWHDVAWFERSILAAGKDPAEPKTFPEVRDSPEIATALARGQALMRRL